MMKVCVTRSRSDNVVVDDDVVVGVHDEGDV